MTGILRLRATAVYRMLSENIAWIRAPASEIGENETSRFRSREWRSGAVFRSRRLENFECCSFPTPFSADGAGVMPNDHPGSRQQER